ncbi:hypothetical protein M3231_22000 [Neobacillus mesonae]|nr:hypothetical protein [Neobacillus mesonae]
MLFSSLETFALFILIITLFKINSVVYAKRVILVIMLINLQSYLLRNELNVDSLAPFVTIVILTLFFNIIVKIPLIPAAFRTILGFVMYEAIQSLLLMIMYQDIEVVTLDASSSYVLQTVSSALLIIITWLIYKYDFGFNYQYDKLKLKFEYWIVNALMLIFMILVSYILYMNQIWLNFMFFSLNLGYFLFFEIKERNSTGVQKD